MRHQGSQMRGSCCTGSHLANRAEAAASGRQQPQVWVVAWEWLSGAALWHINELVQQDTSGLNSMKVIPYQVES